MAGLVMANMGQALSSFGANVGNLMFKSIGDEADRDARLAAKKEEWQARLEDRQAARTENNDLKRELLEMKIDAGGGGGRAGSKGAGGGGSINMDDLAPGGKLAGMIAGKLEMTQPEYEKFYASRKSGDVSAFLQDVDRTSVSPAVEGMGAVEGPTSDAVSRKTAIRTQETVKAAPPGFEAEYRAKLKKLSDLEESYAMGGHYDDMMKGRQQGFQTGVGQGILNKEITGKDIGVASQAVGSSLGKDSYKVEGGEKLNQFTGSSETTPLGKSQITENVAQAGKAAGAGGPKAPRVQSTKEDANGNMILIMSDGTTKPLTGEDGKVVQSSAFNKEVSKLISKMSDEDMAFKKLPAAEQRAKAEERLTGRAGNAAPAADTGLKAKVEAGGQKYEPSKYDYRVGPDGSVQRKLK